MAAYRRQLKDEEGNIIIPALTDVLYPIGSIYMSATLSTAAQVEALLGGEWQAWGAGRIPVGVDTTQTEFNTVGKTGGSKTVTITNNNIPRGLISVSHIAGMEAEFYSEGIVTYGRGAGTTREGAMASITATTYSHTYTFGKSTPDPMNNLQPYITCYMYRRTS